MTSRNGRVFLQGIRHLGVWILSLVHFLQRAFHPSPKNLPKFPMRKNYSFLLSHLLELSFDVVNPGKGPHGVQTTESLSFVKRVGVGERG